MKKEIILLLLVLPISLVAQDYKSDGFDYNLSAHENPQEYTQAFYVLSDQEIKECKTPSAVAWNFVMSIVDQDYTRMESLTDSLLISDFETMMKENNISSYKDFFTEEVINDISGMRPILREGWQLVCDDGWYVDFSDDDIDEYYKTLQGYTLHFDCMKNGEMYSLQPVREHDATARVILVYNKGKWLVIGFK